MILDEAVLEGLKEDVTKKRARLICADVQIYDRGTEVVISKLYHNEFTNTYFERSTQCYPATNVVSSSTRVIDRETVEQDWFAKNKYPISVFLIRKYSDTFLSKIADLLMHAEDVKVSSFLEEAVRIIKFMIKDVRF